MKRSDRPLSGPRGAYLRSLLLVVVANAMLLATIAAQAQTTDTGSSAAGAANAPSSGTNAPSSGTNAASSNTNAASSGTSEPSTGRSEPAGVPAKIPAGDLYAQPGAFGFGAISFVSGFTGCAPTRLGLSDSLGAGGVYNRLRRPAPPPSAPGQFVHFSVGAAEIYTDNLNLTPDERAISDYITEISPRVDACAAAGRVRGTLSYQLQGLVYAHNSEFNRIYNDVAGTTTIELLANHLYLGADTRYGQSVVDPSLAYSDSNIARPGNRTSAWVSNVSPYYLQSLGPLGDSRLSYRYGRTVFGDSDIPESTVNAVMFDLDSPEVYEPVSYHLSAITQRVHRSGGNAQRFFSGLDNSNAIIDDQGNILIDPTLFQDSNNARTSHFDKVTLDLGYRVTRTIELLALGGVEDRYLPDGTNDRLGAELWNVGFRWSSVSNSLEGRVGHRFQGTSYFLRAAHRGRTLDASLEYTQEATTQGLSMLNNNATAQRTGFINPTTSLFDRGVFIQKRWSGALSLNSALTTTTLTGYRETRENTQEGTPDQQFTGVELDTDYQFQTRTTATPFASWQRRDVDGGTGSNTSRVGLALTRAVAPTIQVAASYSHAWRNDDAGRNEYDENRAVLSISKNF